MSRRRGSLLFKPGSLFTLGREGVLAVNVMTAPLAQWAHQKGSGLTHELDATGYPENVVAHVLERLNSATGWSAVRRGSTLLVTRDRDNRRPIF